MVLSGALRSNESLTEGAPLFDQCVVERVRAILQDRPQLCICVTLCMCRCVCVFVSDNKQRPKVDSVNELLFTLISSHFAQRLPGMSLFHLWFQVAHTVISLSTSSGRPDTRSHTLTPPSRPIEGALTQRVTRYEKY